MARIATAARQMSEGQFVATVAHELKAPLHTIETISQSAQSGMWGKPSKALLTQLARVELSARRMLELADSLLRLEQVRSGRLEPLLKAIQPDELIAETQAVLQPFLEERQQSLTYTRGRTSLPVLVDPLYTRHALLNILLNAARYSPVGSTLELIIRQRIESVSIEVRDQAAPLGSQARRQVRSTDALPVYRRDGAGYGMGLFIATQFLKSGGGQLEYHQQRGGGNRFLLCLPVARQLALFPDGVAA